MLFARDLLINMAPWLLACVLATALQAKCLQVRKGNCKWRCAAQIPPRAILPRAII